MNQSTIDRLAPAVRKDFEQFTRPQHRSLLTAHETIETIPAQFKRRLAVKNPMKEGLSEQHWPFVTRYDNWPLHRKTSR